MAAPLASPEVEDALIALSALQHQLFCPRQCALIHVEGLWAEDGATAEGRILHERVDAGRPERRPGVRIVRGLALRSLALGVSGIADVVEFSGRPPRPFPVEYKRGKPKAHRADEVQLCAQAICLEEMFGGRSAKAPCLWDDSAAPHGRLRCRFAHAHRRNRRRGAGEHRRPPAHRRRCACPSAAAARSQTSASPLGWKNHRLSPAGWRRRSPTEEGVRCAAS